MGAPEERAFMTSLENGMLVQHASLGLGKVIAVERSAVHVVFAAQCDGLAMLPWAEWGARRGYFAVEHMDGIAYLRALPGPAA